MHLAQCFKSQVDIVVTYTMMKRKRINEDAKKSFWHLNTKVYALLHLLIVIQKRETAYENESTALARQREIKRREKR